jgi:hypothetical protein
LCKVVGRFLLALILLISTPALVAAAPRPLMMTNLLMVPPDSAIGINYYHESMGYITRSPAGIRRDLDEIAQITSRIKVYHSPYPLSNLRSSAATLVVMKQIVQAAKARHMYVVWTENDDRVMLTDTNWNDYTQRVVSDAAQAQQMGVDEFLVGNEISLHNNGDPGFDDHHLPERIRELAAACKFVFPGKIGYEDGWFKNGTWNQAALVPLDQLYFTLYEPFHTYTTALDAIVMHLGSHAELGEVGAADAKQSLHDSEDDWTRDLLRRYDYARLNHVNIWLFAFRETDNNGYGFFPHSAPDVTGQPHAIWEYIRRRTFLSYHDLLHCDFTNITNADQQCFTGGGYLKQGSFYADAFAQPLLANVGHTDFVFRGTLTPLATTGWESWRATRLVFRYSDYNNYYHLDLRPNSQQWQLYRREYGHEILLAMGSAEKLTLGEDNDFEIRSQGYAQDTTLQLFWNDIKIVDLHDSGNRQVNGYSLGIKNNGVSCALSAVSITDFERSFTVD